MFGRLSQEQKQRRKEELLEGLVQTTSVELAEHLHAEGFLNYLVSIYPHYPLHSQPQIAERFVEDFFAGRLSGLLVGEGWLVHVSFIMEDGVARASYERQDASYWCAEDYVPS